MAGKKRPRGRPTKLTPELTDQIVGLVRVGNYIEVAARACGIDKVNLYAWLNRGNSCENGMHRDFRNAIIKAAAESEAVDLETIRAAAETQWQAAAWRLERKHPQRWGRREYVRHSGNVAHALSVDVRQELLRDEQTTELAAQLAQRLAGSFNHSGGNGVAHSPLDG